MQARFRRGKLEDRFWSKVARGAPDECWEWTARRDRCGYGRIRRGGRGEPQALAHRMSFELATGLPPPADMMVCHRCDNPSCVNPAHLFLGTAQDNSDDMVRKGRSLARADAVHNARLSAEQVRSIRAALLSGRRQIDVAREYGLAKSTVCMLANGQTWRHVA